MRRLVEGKPLPRRMPWEERKRVLRAIRGYLEARGEVLLAVAHGGFVGREVFRDVDLAVFTGGRVGYDDEPYYAYALSDEFSRLTGLPVDVKLLDYAPPGFRIAALRGGIVLVSRLPGLRGILLLRAYDELRGLRRAASHTRGSGGSSSSSATR